MNAPITHTRLSAIGLALAGFSFFVIGDLFMKLASELGMAKYEILIIGSFSGMVTIFLLTTLRGKIEKLRPQKFGGLAILGLLFPFTYGCFLVALPRLPLANFYTVLFLAPTVVSLCAILLLREKLERRKMIATIAGFIGVLIVVNPSHLFGDRSGWVGYGMVFLGMFGLVGQQLMLRHLGNHESRECTAFYPRVGGITAGVILVLALGFEPITREGLIYSIGTGSIGGIGWMCMAEAYRRATASTVAPFHYSQIVTGALAGYLIWHDKPTLRLVIGAVIIILSGIYIATHTRKADERLARRAPIDMP